MTRFKKPFRAVPLRDRDGNVIPFREPQKGRFGGKKSKLSNRKAYDPVGSSNKQQHRKASRHVNFRKAKKNGGWLGLAILVGSICLIAFGVVLRFGIPGIDTAAGPVAAFDAPVAGPRDTLSASFAKCSGGRRANCVVDGDTIWFAGDKIRVLDINTPETSTPQCDAELALGRAATDRLIVLLNQGPFSLESGPEETDRYGRKLRRITRGGHSLGDILVAEGLAERWQGYRRSWC